MLVVGFGVLRFALCL